MKEKNVYFYLGIILALLSLILLLMHVRVGTFHFYRFGRISSGPICIILMIISFIALMVKPCKVTTIFFNIFNNCLSIRYNCQLTCISCRNVILYIHINSNTRMHWSSINYKKFNCKIRELIIPLFFVKIKILDFQIIFIYN